MPMMLYMQYGTVSTVWKNENKTLYAFPPRTIGQKNIPATDHPSLLDLRSEISYFQMVYKVVKKWT